MKRVLNALHIPHIHYRQSTEDEVSSYLTKERKEWINGVGEAVVNAKLFTSEEIALVTFEEFQIFCNAYGLDAYEEAKKIDPEFYLKIQIADYILNNNDRHEQNWGFFMENETGKLIGYCPLFDHDHAFTAYETVMSQTTKKEMTLREAAIDAYRELQLDLSSLEIMDCPIFLSEGQWGKVLERKRMLIG